MSKRTDGFHNIETCFYPVPWCDVLEIILSNDFSFTNTGIPITNTEEENLCVRAYQNLKEAYNLPAVKIHLHKIIPMGAGLGGGSADAAFTLKLLNTICSLDLSVDKLIEIAAQLGSDCPFFLYERAMIGTGRGEVLSAIDVSLAGKYIVIVKPDIHVSTKDAYRNVTPDASKPSIREILQKEDVKDWKNMLANDFEESVFRQYPEIKRIKEMLYEKGAFYASMSGSGSSVYGLFDGPVHLKERFEGMVYWSNDL